MSGLTQASYKGLQYSNWRREGWSARPVAGVTYNPGMVVQAVSQDLQTFTDAESVALPSVGTLRTLLRGVVADNWTGFGPVGTAANFASPASLTAFRGTEFIPIVRKGYHPAVLIDQAGTGAVTLTNGLGLVACGTSGTAGYGQGIGVAAATPLTVYATALLPAASLFGYSLTAASLVQASQTATIAGTPTLGDVYITTIQTPYTFAGGSTAQTTAWASPPLTTARAVSATTAALAVLTYLNAQTSFSTYFTATQSAGVITVTVNALSNPFAVYYGPGMQGNASASFFNISLSGMLANSLTFACSVGAGTVGTYTAGSTTFASGTGFRGAIPAFVHSLL